LNFARSRFNFLENIFFILKLEIYSSSFGVTVEFQNLNRGDFDNSDNNIMDFKNYER